MNERNIKIIKIAAKVVLFTGGVLLGIFLVIKISLYLAPFVIAFAISTLLQPLVRFMVKKLKFPRRIAAFIAVLLAISTLGSIVTMIVISIITQLKNIYNAFPEYYSQIYNSLNTLTQKATEIYSGLPPEFTINIQGVVASLSDSIASLLNSFVKGILNTAISIPEAFVFTLVTVLATYFFTSDRDVIFNFFRTHLPQSLVSRTVTLKNDMFSALFGYIRAQLILMSITFLELNIGFAVIGIKNAVLIAAVISIIDALPILGTGGILVPWAIYSFIIGNINMGLSLTIIYGIVLVVRQLIEPKVLGQQIGLHPLLTLVAMYAGLKLFGFAGLIIGPVTTLIFKNILSGILKNKSLSEYLKTSTGGHSE